ncbi:MAG: carbohydrate kinase [Bryobacterales bacterium]|nr:carbohydrate kinase [Bryobacterales bacterium]
MEGYGAQLAYSIRTTPDGGAEIDPEPLAQLTIDCLDELHRQIQAGGLRVAAVSGSAFWHGLCGVGATGEPTFPILHLLDTRSGDHVARVPNAHERTGCVPHSSYWPAKLLWLAANRPAEFRATDRFLSFQEYLFLKLFGRATATTSMVSATGLWDQNAFDYDQETLGALPIRRDQLADPPSLDRPEDELLPEYEAMWPAFAKARWFPALGDGACNNLGSGCVSPDRAALMVGTSGAMRLVSDAPHAAVAPRLFCYRVDRRRFVTGGALSNGGDVYAWMKRNLALPKDVESRLETARPGTHGLTMLPFFSGERTPYWRADLRAAITGFAASTEAFDILRAALESVALRFREIYCLLSGRWGVPTEVIASGGALLHSPAWTQMMADALGRPITICTEMEASCRGAALWTLERLGIVDSVAALPASTGAVFTPRPEYQAAYHDLLSRQHQLYERLYG